jgi:hypothetical protein
MTLYAIIGFLVSILGWLIIFYAMWRNQRVASRSSIVDTTNFGPRIGAIVEVILHPDHAAIWRKEDGALVFPNMGKDSSEIYGIRPDDGRIT